MVDQPCTCGHPRSEHIEGQSIPQIPGSHVNFNACHCVCTGFIEDVAASRLLEVAALMTEVERWRERAMNAEAALVQIDQHTDGGALKDCIHQTMRNLMPVVINAEPGSVMLLPCPVFSHESLVKIINHHGVESITTAAVRDSPERDGLVWTRIQQAENTQELMRLLNAYQGSTTGGLLCLLHPKRLEQAIQDFAQMRRFELRGRMPDLKLIDDVPVSQDDKETQ